MTTAAPAKTKIKPAIPKPTTVAEYLSWQVNLCGKKQKEIAEEAGFQNANMITMLKQGHSKLPLEKVGALAKALNVDALHLFKLALSEYMPQTFAEITRMFHQPILTQNEIDIIETIRKAKVANPKLRTNEERRALLDVINDLKGDNETRDD